MEIKRKTLSKEHKIKIGMALKGKPISEERRKKLLLANIGKHHSETTRKRMSLSHRKFNSEITRKKISIALTGKPLSEGRKKKISIALTGKQGNNKGRHFSETWKKNMSLARKKCWQNPNYREKCLKKMFEVRKIHPNNPENLLNSLLQKNFSNEWKFVGDGSFLVGFKSPDFVNINGQKKLIELYGDYWHRDEKKSNGSARVAHFKKYGFDTLIIWQNELKNPEQLVEKIKNF